MKIVLVIPLYNEKKHIISLLNKLARQKVSVVVVDDGSGDSSLNLVREFCKKHEGTTVLSHRINLGKGAAMKTGADFAFEKGADAVIFMDSDEQHNPDDLDKFAKMLVSGKFGVVFGSRDYGLGVPLVRFLGNKFASILINLIFGIYVSDSICGYRAMTKDAYKKIRWDSSGYGVETEILARVGKNKIPFCEVKVDTIYHDSVKGVTLLDAFSILPQVVKWWLTI